MPADDHEIGEDNPNHLLDKIGGPVALEAAVDIFYEKLVADETLEDFFEGIDIDRLKGHQRKFLTLALTKVPAGVDVPMLMHDKHHRLFGLGLNASHFDSVAKHLVATLVGLQVKQGIIDEIVAVVAPFRKVFEEGAKEHLLDRIGGPPALDAAVDIFYERLVGDKELEIFFEGIDVDTLKTHQRKFLTLALTKVPEGINVPEMMMEKHTRLFKMGLSEKHFDLVAKHLVETLEALQVHSKNIDGIISIIAPLRSIFEEGARIHSKGGELAGTIYERFGGENVIESAIDMFYERISVDEKFTKFCDKCSASQMKSSERDFIKNAFAKHCTEDLGKYVGDGLGELFAIGLNESHFDYGLIHAKGTLEALNVDVCTVEESIDLMRPLRAVFVKNAEAAKP